MTYAFRNSRQIDRPHQTTQRNPFGSRNLRGALFGNEPLGARHHHNDIPSGGQAGKGSMDQTETIRGNLKSAFSLIEKTVSEAKPDGKGTVVLTPEEYVVISGDGELKRRAYELMKQGVGFFFNSSGQSSDQNAVVIAGGRKTPDGPVLDFFMTDSPKPASVDAIVNLSKPEHGGVAITNFDVAVGIMMVTSDTYFVAKGDLKPRRRAD